MSALRGNVPGDFHRPGGITGYPLDRIYEEVAFIGYYMHWPHDQLMQMSHAERKRWCDEVSNINQTLSDNKGK
jgi:hypothetical protein